VVVDLNLNLNATIDLEVDGGSIVKNNVNGGVAVQVQVTSKTTSTSM
jgi:hypothetical protein